MCGCYKYSSTFWKNFVCFKKKRKNVQKIKKSRQILYNDDVLVCFGKSVKHRFFDTDCCLSFITFMSCY